jgi:hypothetical protein
MEPCAVEARAMGFGYRDDACGDPGSFQRPNHIVVAKATSFVRARCANISVLACDLRFAIV